jgi:hypothetical protein
MGNGAVAAVRGGQKIFIMDGETAYMRRRQFVAALPLASGLAGCLSGSEPTESTGTDRPEPAETASTDTGTPEPAKTVSPTLRSSYRYVINDDAIGVTPPERAQFAFVRPPDAHEERPPDAYALKLGSERFAPATSVSGFMSWTPGIDSVYTDDRRSGSLRFDVPAVEADSAQYWETVAAGSSTSPPANASPPHPTSVSTPCRSRTRSNQTSDSSSVSPSRTTATERARSSPGFGPADIRRPSK